LLIFVVSWPAASGIAVDAPQVEFARDVQPILESACCKCHGREKQQGGVRFDRRAGAFAEGDSGQRAITPGRIAASELIRRVEATDDSERMPQNAPPLSTEQIKILRTWIEQGAKWPEAASTSPTGPSEMVVTAEDRQHWSYVPLRTVKAPAVWNEPWIRTPIDRFILAALEAQGLRPNPPVDKRALIRRVYFDLIGLPPSPEEVEEFLTDSREAAYEQLIERLLASSHYGERWGRHWLDLTRYADSDGLETDLDRPTAYHYRDFVIRSLNDDLSYQTFVRWQLAGDEYEPDLPRALAATGFLTTAPIEMLMVPMEEEKLRLRYNELDDIAVTTTATFLGLTIGCARCHDHKFDAIPTRDYYRLQSAFTTTSRGNVLLTTRAEAAAYRDAESQSQNP
jgi:cytochrome c553